MQMTRYARRDLLLVAVPPDRGGCGTTHTRPYDGGEAAEIWSLDCPRCTVALQDDPLWAGTISEIPETPDETAQREDREKRGERDRDNRQEALMTSIADAMKGNQEFQQRLLQMLLAEGQPQLATSGPMEPPPEMPAGPGPLACPQCGGPLRKPGAKGRTPKLCADCRAK
jgi:hypothetical protein